MATACRRLLGHPAFKRFQVLEARHLDQFEQERGTVSKPVERFGTDLEMLRIPRLHIGFIERVEPGAFSMLVAWKGVRQPAILFLRERAQEFDVVRWGRIVGQREQNAGECLFKGLV